MKHEKTKEYLLSKANKYDRSEAQAGIREGRYLVKDKVGVEGPHVLLTVNVTVP